MPAVNPATTMIPAEPPRQAGNTEHTLNRVTLVGVAARDPEVARQLESVVARLPVQTHRLDRVAGEMRRRTEWHRIVARNRLAEIVSESVKRGSRVYVEGRLEYTSLEREGTSVPMVEIVAQDMILLEGTQSADDSG